MNYKKLTRSILSEAEPIDFQTALRKQGTTRARQHALGIHNRVAMQKNQELAKPPVEFEDALPVIRQHRWVSWTADQIIDAFVAPYAGGRQARNPVPDDLPQSLLKAADDFNLKHEWFDTAVGAVMETYRMEPDHPVYNFSNVKVIRTVPPAEQARRNKLLKSWLETGNHEAFMTFVAGHPEYLYHLVAHETQKFWPRIWKWATFVAAGYIWERVADPDQRKAMLGSQV